MKPDIEELRKKYIENPPEGMTSRDIRHMSDEVEVDFDSGMIYNRTKGTEFKGQAFPEFMQKIIKAEGLVNYINAQH